MDGDGAIAGFWNWVRALPGLVTRKYLVGKYFTM
jgi:hypothetical protein